MLPIRSKVFGLFALSDITRRFVKDFRRHGGALGGAGAEGSPLRMDGLATDGIRDLEAMPRVRPYPGFSHRRWTVCCRMIG